MKSSRHVEGKAESMARSAGGAVVVVVVALLGAGLYGTPASASVGGATTPGSGACSGGGTSGTTPRTLRFAGASRLVLVHTPTAYTGRTPVPLVLNLHGRGATG